MEITFHDQNMLMRMGILFVGMSLVWLLTFPAQHAWKQAYTEGEKHGISPFLDPAPIFKTLRVIILLTFCYGLFSTTQSYGPRNALVADPKMERATSTDVVKNIAPKTNEQFEALEKSLDQVIEDALKGTTQ